jgi:hypothetical protein
MKDVIHDWPDIGVEEITTHNLTACRDFAGQNLGRAGHHLRQIEQDTVKPWRGIKNRPEQLTLTASNVDQSLEAREVGRQPVVRKSCMRRPRSWRLKRPIRAIPTNYSILDKSNLFNEFRDFILRAFTLI